MPRYFIDTHDGDAFHQDDAGIEAQDDQAARKAAIEALPDMARETMPDGDHRTMRIGVRNASGRLIYQASMLFEGGWRKAENE